jgi:GNAT superfamily N-acetyltransferase
MKIEIRDILPQDIQSVFDLAAALAEHEQISARFALTPEKMQNDIFGAQADWYGVVALVSEEIIGFALYSYSKANRAVNPTDALFIDDLFIKPEYRQMGIGKALLKALAKKAQEKQIARIELWCLKANAPAQAFYEQLGAQKMDNLDVFRFQVNALDSD